MSFGLEELASQRESQVKEVISRLKQESSDNARLQVLLQALEGIRTEISESVVDKVTVLNQDEIKASLHNELNRISKPIISAIDKLALDKTKLEEIKRDIEAKNAIALEENFDLQIIRKPKHRMMIDNLSDIAFPDTFEVRNLADLQKYFDSLSDVIRSTFNIEIPTPQVTVNPPQVNVPEIVIPQSSVNVDLSGLLEALDPLKFISDRPNKPISVRLSDGEKFLKAVRTILENQERQAVAFSQGLNESALKKALKSTQNVVLSTSGIFSGNTELTPKFAVIDDATSGDNTIVAAVTGKKIRVLQAFLVSAGTVNTRFESGAGGTALTGQMNLIANTGFVLPFSPLGWFETAASTLLNLELSGAISVDGSLTYVEV